MSSFSDVTLPANVWTDLSTLVGSGIGVALKIQNKSTVSIAVETDDVEPVDSVIGFQMTPYGKTYSSVQADPQPSELVWCKPLSNSDGALVSVELA